MTEEQWAAVRGAFESRISVLTGGPGVGKTRCTTEIVAAAEDAGAKIALCAPTGRAARRLQETTGHEAQTIHRMLEWIPGGDPGFGPGRPLPVDLAIVDESSMLNLRLAEVLLEGLAETTHIVFVGDADQLPPIGAGKPFEDLIASGAAPVVRLTQIFRQAARSMITTAAHEINQGRPPHLEPGPDQERDFFFIERPSPERALETVVEVVAERAPESFGVDPIRDVQTLAPMYRGPVGIDALNERLQERLNPDGKRAVGERFRVGDRLIQTRNSHELGLMNGSIVFLRRDDPDEEKIVVDTDEGCTLVMPYSETATLKLAYAISVHKAQGCEVPVVVAVCHRSHTRMLTRPLLYTAITRARRDCVLVGDSAALAAAVGRGEGGGRHSGLAAPARRADAERAAPALPDARRVRTPAVPSRHERPRVPWMEIGLTVVGIALLAGLVLAVPALRHAAVAAVHGETDEVREQIKSLGAAGPLIIIGLAIVHSVVPYPAEIVNAAAGFAYGFFGGARDRRRRLDDLGAASVTGSAPGWRGRCSIAGSAPSASTGLERMVERGGVTLLIALRLLPIVPFSLISPPRAPPGSPSAATAGRPRSASCRSPRWPSTSGRAWKASASPTRP